MVARRVNSWIPDFEGLNLPSSVVNLCKYDQGMILLAGVTGAGKSTTIASMLVGSIHDTGVPGPTPRA